MRSLRFLLLVASYIHFAFAKTNEIQATGAIMDSAILKRILYSENYDASTRPAGTNSTRGAYNQILRKDEKLRNKLKKRI